MRASAPEGTVSMTRDMGAMTALCSRRLDSDTRASGHRVEVVEGFARQARERPGRGIDLILPFSRRKALELIEECRLPSPGQQPHIARLHLGCKRLRPDLFRTGNPVGIDREPRQASDRSLDALLAATARLLLDDDLIRSPAQPRAVGRARRLDHALAVK